MLIKSTALILKKVNFGDENLILQTFTKEEGTQSYFMSIAMTKGRSKLSLPPLSLVEIVASRGKGSLPRIKEIQHSVKHFDLISNMHKSSIVMFLNELLLKTIREYQCDEDLFNFISESLTVLDEHQSNEVNFHLKFLLELSLHLGFYPNGQYSESFPYFDLYEGVFTSEQSLHKAVIGPDLSPRFSELIQLSISECDKVKLSNQERRALLSLLVDYYKIHIDKFDGLQSKEVLEAVLN